MCLTNSFPALATDIACLARGVQRSNAHCREGLRSQFNAPRAVGLLRAVEDDDSYWQRVLQYGGDGNLQAVLDEYVHVLFESCRLSEHAPADALSKLAAPMFDAMTLRTATLRPEEISTTDGQHRASSRSAPG